MLSSCMAINFCCSQQILNPFLLTYNEAYRHNRIKENGNLCIMRSEHSDIRNPLAEKKSIKNIRKKKLSMN